MNQATLSQFAGLDLRSDPEQAGGSIDCLNVEFDRPGRVRTRDGFAQQWSGTALLRQILMPYVSAASNTTTPTYQVLGVVQVAGPNGTLVDALAGTSLSGAGAARTPNQTTYTLISTPVTDRLYIAGDAARGATTTRGIVQYWDGTNLTNSVGKPFYLATTPYDNRLVQAGYDLAASSPSGANGSWSTVFFSDPGAPDTFGANNYVLLHPGDGERITGACVWRNLVIITKETRMFVFYGTSTDSTGNPIFNYRTVSLPARVPEMLSRPIVEGTDAFYILTYGGVYASTGDVPTLISQPIDQALVGAVPSTWSDYTSSPTLMGLSFAANRLWVHINNGTTGRSFVYDPRIDQWTYSTIGTHVLSNQSGNGVYFVGQATDNQTTGATYLTSPTATTDAGAAISSRYRTGFLDYGTPGTEKHIREFILDGTGSVTMKRATNDTVALGTGQVTALGTSPAVAQGRDRRGLRGRNVSVEMSSTTAQWSVSRMYANIQAERASGNKATL